MQRSPGRRGQRPSPDNCQRNRRGYVECLAFACPCVRWKSEVLDRYLHCHLGQPLPGKNVRTCNGSIRRRKRTLDLTLIGNAGENGLFEDDHIILSQPEVIVLLEEFLRWSSRRPTGHYVPRYDNVLLPTLLLGQLLDLPDSLGLYFEQ